MMQPVKTASDPPPGTTRLFMLLLALPTAVQAYTSCPTGWYGSVTDCLPYYGGYTAQSSVPVGWYGIKGTMSCVTPGAGKNIVIFRLLCHFFRFRFSHCVRCRFILAWRLHCMHDLPCEQNLYLSVHGLNNGRVLRIW